MWCVISWWAVGLDNFWVMSLWRLTRRFENSFFVYETLSMRCRAACADVSKDTEAYVLLSMSCLPSKSTSSRCARRQSLLIMDWWISVMVNVHTYLYEAMLRER